MALTQARVTTSVRVQMALRRMSQGDLGAALGVTQTAVSARLRGRTRWSVDDLDRLAELFGVPVSELVDPPAAYMRTGSVNATREKRRTRRAFGGAVVALPLPRVSFEQVAA